jgi:hypothetical protein
MCMATAPGEPLRYRDRPFRHSGSPYCLVAYAPGRECHRNCIGWGPRVSGQAVHRQVLLLVKDETTRGTIEWTLRGNGGFELVHSDSAADAIRRLRREDIQPDIVLLDWQVIGAGEILRYFVSQPRYVRARVIVLSDHQGDIPQLCVNAIVPRAVTGSDILATLDKIDPRERSQPTS